MTVFIKANGYKLWQIIDKGDLKPVDEQGNEKPESRWTEADLALLELNNKATHMIQSALTPKELFRVCHLGSAKEMWDALKIAHEGTSGVKDRKVETLVEEFHKFEMHDGERIRDLEIRFTHLINNRAALGRKVTERE